MNGSLSLQHLGWIQSKWAGERRPMVVEGTGGCWTSSLAGRSKVGGGLEHPWAMAKLSLSPNRLKWEDKKSEEPTSEEPARLKPDSLAPPFLCLSYFFRLFSGAAAATPQTTNNFPFSGTWLLQILVCLYTLTLPMPPPLPCSAMSPREAVRAKALLHRLVRRHVHSCILWNSSASLLSSCFVAHIVAPVCHHMANGYPATKRARRKWGSERMREKGASTIGV